MSSKPIFIHAGAHRTGTSSFQNCLSANRATLEREGFDLAYPDRDGAPGGELALRLPQPRHRRDKDKNFEAFCRMALATHDRGAERPLILSEENLPGRMMHFYAGQFYPAARRRLRVFKGALPGPVSHVIYVIRPYDALFVSGFRKRAEDNPVSPFKDSAERMVAFKGGWPEMLGTLRKVLSPTRMTVVEYGRRGASRDLLALLIGGAAERFKEPEQALNTSATDAALIELQRRYLAGEKLQRPAWQQVIRENADRNEDMGFAAFTPEQSETLRNRYAVDLDRIENLDGLTLLR
ncbi:MAG: hypothetical protein CSA70_07555 [Rhodobacterales bacterium]|nr:MAG: hypothetical protein CSA70_07555 [Rhodobacterales bacterium]